MIKIGMMIGDRYEILEKIHIGYERIPGFFRNGL